MKYLFDKNICIYTIKCRSEEVFRRVEACRIGDIGISSITYSELCYGESKSQAVKRNRAALERFVAPLEILEFGSEAALAYGEVRAALEQKVVTDWSDGSSDWGSCLVCRLRSCHQQYP